MIDTAQAQEWYDESLVGQALARTNVQLSSIVVVTKVHPRSFAEDKLVASIQDSKKLLYPGHLNKQTLDVVLLHAPYCWRDHCSEEEESHDWKEAWFALEALKKSGDIAAIGVSNFDARLLRELLDIANVKVSVIQNWMDPFQQDNEVRELAATYDIAYMAYSSYGTQWEWKLHRNPVFTSKDLKAIAHTHTLPDLLTIICTTEMPPSTQHQPSAVQPQQIHCPLGVNAYVCDDNAVTHHAPALSPAATTALPVVHIRGPQR
jgi:diketogulonate reductase-like aldo/keto reductase